MLKRGRVISCRDAIKAHVIPGAEPIDNVKPRVASRELQSLELELLRKFNSSRQAERENDAVVDARIRSFETAYGMQSAAPEAFDVSQETESTFSMYGMNSNDRTGFGWQCLMRDDSLNEAYGSSN